MSDKVDKEHLKELKEMVKERKPNQKEEEVLAIFCQRHGLTMETCRLYYDQLKKSSENKKK
jgi:hypothetical protein